MALVSCNIVPYTHPTPYILHPTPYILQRAHRGATFMATAEGRRFLCMLLLSGLLFGTDRAVTSDPVPLALLIPLLLATPRELGFEGLLLAVGRLSPPQTDAAHDAARQPRRRAY